jgi:hypothetical protein
METKKAMVKAALERGERLTPLDGLQRFGTMRLADVVFKLKKEGLAIVTNIVTVRDQFGNSVDVAEYRRAFNEKGEGELSL